LAAFDKSDLPQDPNAIFLTVRRAYLGGDTYILLMDFQSWGEWWDPNEIFPLSLDQKLQDEWCPSREDIEREVKL